MNTYTLLIRKIYVKPTAMN